MLDSREGRFAWGGRWGGRGGWGGGYGRWGGGWRRPYWGGMRGWGFMPIYRWGGGCCCALPLLMMVSVVGAGCVLMGKALTSSTPNGE